VSAADGWGQADSGGGRSVGARAEMGRVGHEGGEERGARERGGVGPDSAQPRGKRFFLFIFSISISFISFFF
jgi:hypothetical protein